jgi:S1-C subfamily serine protease
VGAEVLSVQPRSRAERAAIQQGDVITVAAGQLSPTPAQVTRAFTALPEGGSLLVAIARGTEHRVAAIEK